MAGLFRFTPNNSTPKRRTIISPFCTSPGQLQDVTMDSTYALGYRSPNISLTQGGNSSPGQGRSVREFEEQMASLRNENFNLKLRLYFLEQKIPGYNSANTSSDGHESLLKQNVDLKVDIEVLKKELQQKQALLCEAAKAMELMEEQQKDNEDKSRVMIEELGEKIQYLEVENKQLEKCAGHQNIEELMGRSDLLGNVDILQKVRELEDQIKLYEDRTKELANNQTDLQKCLAAKEESLNVQQEIVKQMKFQIDELQEQLEEKSKEAANLEKKCEARARKMTSEKESEMLRLTSENKSLHSSIERLKSEVDREKTNFDDRNRKLKEQQQLMEEMQLTIINKKNNATKLSKTLEEYERMINEFRIEHNSLSRENANLKDIIVKLEHSKLKDFDSARSLDIYLGKRMSSGDKDDRQIERRRLLPLSPKDDHESRHHMSNPFLVNPLFHQVSTEYETIGDTGNCRTAEFKLKQKLSVYMNETKPQIMSSQYPDASFYIQKTKDFHNGKYVSSKSAKLQSYSKDEVEINRLPANIERAIKSMKRNPPGLQDAKSTDDSGAALSTTPTSSSETSLVSCLSHPTTNAESGSSRNKTSEKSMGSQSERDNLKIPKLREELQASKKQLADKICQIDMLQESAEEKAIQHEKAIKTIQKLVSRTNELEKEIYRLKKSHESQTSMSYMKEDSKKSDIDSIIQSDEQLEDSTFDVKIKALATEKNIQIARLKLDIEKKTIQLQNLINKALWDKSREIERLTKALGGSITPNPILPDLSPLSASYTDSEYSQALEQNKQLQSMADMLIEKLSKTSERSADKSAQQLHSQLREAQENVEKAQRFSKDYRDMFVVLVSRLEELAGFLDSLLKHKDILGVLASDRRKAMRKAVDSSLEFSRSLTNISVSFNRSSIGENSLEMLLNFTHLLDQTSDKENRTTNSLNDTTGGGNNQLVEYLQAEVKALKNELEKKQRGPDSAKKERRSLPMRLENQSESEAWSEPDRTVSLARIGLEDSLIVKAAAKTKDSDNTSSDILTDPSRKSKSKTLDRINQLEDLISQKDNRILEIQCDLVEADNRLKEEAMKRMEVMHELEEYRRVNGMLEIEIATFKQQASQHETLKRDIEIYKRELEEKQLAIEKVIEGREQLAVDLRVAEMKIESMQQDYEIMRAKLENELDQTMKREKEKQISLEAELLRSHEEELKQIEDKHKEYLAREWVSRVIYEETKRQLEDAQKKLIEAQLTIDFLRDSETELNGELIENEKSQRSLKQKLDEATLQSSKIGMERTKAVSEKLQLEAQIQQLTVQLKTIKRENERFKEVNNKLNNKLAMVRDEIQKPVAQRARGNDMSQSGYTSEEVPTMAARKTGGQTAQRSENPSPDLGIESDVGRTSGTDTGAGNVKDHGAIVKPKPERKLHIVDESTQPVSSTSAEETARAQQAFDNSVDNNANLAIGPKRESTTGHDCAKVDQELIDLRRKVNRQKRALEDTWNKLRSANRRKEQVERDIRHQILKTNNVLQNVRSNMESEVAQVEKDIKRDIRLPLMK